MDFLRYLSRSEIEGSKIANAVNLIDRGQ